MTDTAAKAEPASVPIAAKEAASPKVDAQPTPASAVAKAAPVVAKPIAAAKPVAPKPAATAPRPKAAPVAAAPKIKQPVAKKPARSVPAPARPKQLSAAKPAITAAKEYKMADTIKTMTDKTQTMFADANDRAKGAMEKGQKAIEEMTAFHKGNLEAFVESGKIAAKGFEKIGQDAATYAKSSYETATSAMKSMASAKSPTELFKLQSDFARSSFDAFVAETSRSTEAMLKLAGEIAQPLSNRAALAAEKIKVAA